MPVLPIDILNKFKETAAYSFRRKIPTDQLLRESIAFTMCEMCPPELPFQFKNNGELAEWVAEYATWRKRFNR